MIPFSPQQHCAKCGSKSQLLPRHHKAWFSRDEWLEYECVCGYTFRTETADAQKARELSEADLNKLYAILPPPIDEHGNTIDVVSVLTEAK